MERGACLLILLFHGADSLKHFAGDARGQHIASGMRHAGEDLGHLRRGLAGGKDHLRHPGA